MSPRHLQLIFFHHAPQRNNSAAACCLNTAFSRLSLPPTTMKLLYILLAVVPLALAAAPPPADKTACKCALVKCVSTQPELCQCENANEKRCAELCGRKEPHPKKCPQICGSRGLPPCPKGLTCIDNPDKPGCSTAADCPGLCVKLDGPFCGGIAAFKCPREDEGQRCVDDPRDECSPPTGADCGGTCVFLDGRSSKPKPTPQPY